ncbi:MAG TPA: hypothetical protein VHX59_17575 [Mycobacteriales bacterium]|jgi:hypothetical protein|nr:hypothetical protein [Mycobacteriales bacterium]
MAVGFMAVGCGGGENGGHGTPKHGSTASASDLPSGSQSGSATASDGVAAMNFKHVPGQAGKVQQTLTGAGFECTRHSDQSIDLRLCSKGQRLPDSQYDEGPQLVGGMLRYFSAPDGTVLFAKITATGINNAAEWDAMRLQMLKSIVPAEDAAVIAADGDKLTWGTYFTDPAHPSDGWLQATGYDPTTLAPSGDPLSITKEQALTKLTAAKLECSFGDISGGETDTMLGCSNPEFDDSSADGVMTRIELTDTGDGISDIEVIGMRDQIKTELPAVRAAAPKLSALGDTKVVPGLLAWAKTHLDNDGVPHAAYIGDRLVQTGAGGSPVGGVAVELSASVETPALGFDPSKVTGN